MGQLPERTSQLMDTMDCLANVLIAHKQRTEDPENGKQ